MILPGATLGVLGGGQLGRMFTAAAQRMGFRIVAVDPDADAPAGQIADLHIQRSWEDPDVMHEVAERCAGVTIEFENIPADVLRALAAHTVVRPRGDAVAATQDRLDEKSFLNGLGIATVDWAPVANSAQLGSAWTAIGAADGVLKTARMGYDGKGQAVVTSIDELQTAWKRLGNTSCILERRVPLEREISVMVARSHTGAVRTWPLAENVHRNGILHTSVVPADVSTAIADQARDAACRIVAALDYVGVMGVECFLTGDGRLLINELAPRPHNSGHWTLDACATSQFEQQVRCLAGLPLGVTTQTTPIAMVNLLGDLWRQGTPRWDRALEIEGVRLHLYGKREARDGRKMGHLTAMGPDTPTALDRALQAWRAVSGDQHREAPR